jgi:transposase, IS5 family
VIRDIRRKIAGNQRLQERFADLLALGGAGTLSGSSAARAEGLCAARREVSALAKAVRVQGIDRHPATKPRAASSCCTPKRCTATVRWPNAGPVISQLERQTGVTTRRIHVDKGYRGHNHKEKFRVWISGQLRRVTKPRIGINLGTIIAEGARRPRYVQ